MSLFWLKANLFLYISNFRIIFFWINPIFHIWLEKWIWLEQKLLFSSSWALSSLAAALHPCYWSGSWRGVEWNGSRTSWPDSCASAEASSLPRFSSICCRKFEKVWRQGFDPIYKIMFEIMPKLIHRFLVFVSGRSSVLMTSKKEAFTLKRVKSNYKLCISVILILPVKIRH